VGAARETGEVPWTSEFCRMKKAEPGIRNIYMELGSTFGQLVTTRPSACAHLLGQVIDAFGADHVLWGTDSIWYGTPQWQIEAFPPLPAPRRARGAARLRAAPPGREGADLRAQRSAGLRRRRGRRSPRDPEGLRDADEDGVSWGWGRPEPSLVRLGG